MPRIDCAQDPVANFRLPRQQTLCRPRGATVPLEFGHPEIPRAVEDAFVALLDALRPRPEFLRLFKAVVLDVWKARQAEATTLTETLSRRASEIRSRREKLVDAFVYSAPSTGRRSTRCSPSSRRSCVQLKGRGATPS
jgi:hypothetical protein